MRIVIQERARVEMGLAPQTKTPASPELESQQINSIEPSQAALSDKSSSMPVAQINKKPRLMDAARGVIAYKYNSTPGQHTVRWWKGRFWQWDGKRYAPLDADVLKAEVMQCFDENDLDIIPYHAKQIVDSISAVTLLLPTIEPPCWVDGCVNSWDRLISLQNGMLDVDAYTAGQEETLIPHSPSYFSMNTLRHDFDPISTCPKWLDFLEEIFEGDSDIVDIIQEIFGYCLLPDTSLNKAFIFVGEGANGKTVVLRTLSRLVGRDNCSSVPLESFGQRFQMAQTLGKLVNLCEDVGELDRLAEGSIKMFTDGSEMTFEYKGKDTFSARPTARLVIATNNLPRFSDKSEGIWRRLKVIPFDYRIPEHRQDTRYKEDHQKDWIFHDELPGIFIWALDGLQRLKRNKIFTEAKSCTNILNQYRLDCNPAKTFLTDNYKETLDTRISVDVVYKKYKQFCDEGEYRKLSKSNFGKEVFRTFPRAEKVRAGTRGNRYNEYVGISDDLS